MILIQRRCEDVYTVGGKGSPGKQTEKQQTEKVHN